MTVLIIVSAFFLIVMGVAAFVVVTMNNQFEQMNTIHDNIEKYCTKVEDNNERA